MMGIDMSDGLDTELAVLCLALAVLLTIYAAVVSIVRQLGKRPGPMYRYALREVRQRGIAHHRPTITVTPDKGHALIEWSEDGQERAILLSWHHVLDSEHTTHMHEETE